MVPVPVGGTIWDELPESQVDTQKLEHLFESRAKDLMTKVKSLFWKTSTYFLYLDLVIERLDMVNRSVREELLLYSSFFFNKFFFCKLQIQI